MEKILRGISNTARLDGGKDCQQVPLTHLARRAARWCFILEVAWYKQENWQVWAKHPAIVNPEARF